jgi:hypothetical protein
VVCDPDHGCPGSCFDTAVNVGMVNEDAGMELDVKDDGLRWHEEYEKDLWVNELYD